MPNPDGGSGYVLPSNWVNLLKTGNLLSEMALVGDHVATQRVQDALGYIAAHWYDLTLVTGWGYDPTPEDSVAQYQAAYCLMKGLDSMGIDADEIPGVADWYQDFADVIVPQQQAGGSWPDSAAFVWPDGTEYVVDSLLSTLWALLTLERVAPPEIVPVDIMPTSCRNPLNVKSKGVLPVAILGTEDFDVTQIDPASVRLEGVAPMRWALEDVATPYEPYIGKEDCFDCTTEGPDGYLDLTLKFGMQEVVAALGDVNDGDCLVLTLTGNLMEEYGGIAIVGEDVVTILKKE
jgi:hypothetical protein